MKNMKKPCLCPKCGGRGFISKPPYVSEIMYKWVDNVTGGYVCSVCGGEGILWSD